MVIVVFTFSLLVYWSYPHTRTKKLPVLFTTESLTLNMILGTQWEVVSVWIQSVGRIKGLKRNRESHKLATQGSYRYKEAGGRSDIPSESYGGREGVGQQELKPESWFGREREEKSLPRLTFLPSFHCLTRGQSNEPGWCSFLRHKAG